jgi:hypothetical protein
LPFLIMTLLALGAPRPTLAQTGSENASEPPIAEEAIRDPNGHPFRSLASSPLEPVHRLAPVHVSRGEEEGWVALAELGDRLSFWIHRDAEGRFELAGALGIGAFSRFDLETTNNEFQEVHYRVGFMLRARYRGIAARADFYHISSHLGDEYLLRTGREPIDASREGIEILLQTAPHPWLLVYGGGGVLTRSTGSLRRLSARGGLELSPPSSSRIRPYLSLEVYGWEEVDWEPLAAMEGGIAIGAHSRLGLLFSTGPSRADQFVHENETLFGLGYSFRR